MAAPKMNYPLKDIPQPHPHDVLCGRGGGTNAHIGNSHWRMLVSANKELYVTLPKRQKMLLSKSIVNAVRSQNPPGRFLQKDSNTELWYDVGDQRAQEKTSQALREGAPDIRSKLKSPTSEQQPGAAPPSNPTAMAEAENAGPSSGRRTPADAGNRASPAPQQQATPPMPPVQPPQMKSSNSAATTAPPPMPPSPAMMPGGAVAPPMGAPNMAAPVPLPPAAATANSGTPSTQPMMFYPGPGMAPVQVVPILTVNEKGETVAAVRVVPSTPPQMPQPVSPQGPLAQRKKKTPPNLGPSGGGGPAAGGAPQAAGAPPPGQQQPPDAVYSNIQQQQQQNAKQQHNNMPPPAPQQPTQHKRKNSDEEKKNGSTENYSNNNNQQHKQYASDLFAEPPSHLDHTQFSFGSMMMTDAEQARLMSGFGNAPGDHQYHHNNNYGNNSNSLEPIRVHFAPDQVGQQYQGGGPPTGIVAPVDGGLEPAGLSFGSVMSIGTDMKLEPAGLSFGSQMSFSVAGGPKGGFPEAVDGGLEAIGTSFGSMSLATTDQQLRLLESLNKEEQQLAGYGGGGGGHHQQQFNQTEAEATPTFLQQQKSKGNLLECSDTESEDESQKAQLNAQKSVEWEKLKAVLASQQSGQYGSGGDPYGDMPPPPPGAASQTNKPVMLSIPNMPLTSNLDRDFSQISALSVEEHAQQQQFFNTGGYWGGGGGGGDPYQHEPVLPTARKSDTSTSEPNLGLDGGGNDGSMPPPPPANLRKHESDGGWQVSHPDQLAAFDYSLNNNNDSGNVNR